VNGLDGLSPTGVTCPIPLPAAPPVRLVSRESLPPPPFRGVFEPTPTSGVHGRRTPRARRGGRRSRRAVQRAQTRQRPGRGRHHGAAHGREPRLPTARRRDSRRRRAGREPCRGHGRGGAPRAPRRARARQARGAGGRRRGRRARPPRPPERRGGRGRDARRAEPQRPVARRPRAHARRHRHVQGAVRRGVHLPLRRHRPGDEAPGPRRVRRHLRGHRVPRLRGRPRPEGLGPAGDVLRPRPRPDRRRRRVHLLVFRRGVLGAQKRRRSVPAPRQGRRDGPRGVRGDGRRRVLGRRIGVTRPDRHRAQEPRAARLGRLPDDRHAAPARGGRRLPLLAHARLPVRRRRPPHGRHAHHPRYRPPGLREAPAVRLRLLRLGVPRGAPLGPRAGRRVRRDTLHLDDQGTH